MLNQAHAANRARFEWMRAVLNERFPGVFPDDAMPRPPLAVGIRTELLEHAGTLGFSSAEVTDFLTLWCNRPRYLLAIAQERPRVNLRGVIVERVSPQHAAWARGELIRRRKFLNSHGVRAPMPVPGELAEAA